MRFFLPSLSLALVLVPVLPAYAAVHRVVLDGPVDAIHAEYVVRAIDQAEQEGSRLILFELNTPGGSVDDMEAIISRMLRSRVPVCTYVHPPGGRAASAGFFILLSADVAAMAPGTRTGAAHPILSIGGILPLPEPEKGDEKEAKKKPASQETTLIEKIRNDIQAFLRAVAEKRGRDIKAAELAVSESRSYADQEALENRLIDLVAASETDLLAALDGRTVRLIDGTPKVLAVRDGPVIAIPMTFRENVLAALTNPNIAFLLLLIGALLVYIEVTHAGLVLPGVIGGMCLLLAVTGFSFLPISAAGVVLLLAAVGLFIAEVKVQGFGVLGVAGVVCLALGGIMLVDVPEPEFRIDPWLATGAAVTFGGIALFLATLAMRASRRKPVSGNEGMVGIEGDAFTDIDPSGKVRLMGEYWDAVSKKPVARGSRVRCVAVKGLVLDVEPVEGVSSVP